MMIALALLATALILCTASWSEPLLARTQALAVRSRRSDG
ncbi:hypothetical protein J2Z31_002085 [Sinorhizobium kostiense]|uniref:Uncharacterized protein n=1 Tax=Sinorhizobium kostiense TaxID=76747 RepID=A0ABS4QY88_9HYPH|nr:hypothetical protein [Sinorhizobium kostiense]